MIIIIVIIIIIIIIIIINIIIIILYQNVRITEVLTAATERLLTLLTTVVTVDLDLVGFVLRGQPAHDCQLHVHRKTDVALMQPAG